METVESGVSPMTAPHPEAEYIITEEMVRCIEAWTEKYPVVSEDIASVIRSRPVSQQSDSCKKQGCDDIENCDEMRTGGMNNGN